MPTILRAGPYRFYFFSHEPNEPAHVHVDRQEYTAKFWLKPVRLARNYGCSGREVRAIHDLVIENQEKFQEAWHGYFVTRSR